MPPQPGEHAGDFTAQAPTLVREFELRGSHRLAVAAISVFDAQRLVLEDLSSREAAIELGIEERAASKRYFRALARLGKLIEQFPGMSPGG